jgi:hypothetical protein
MDMSDRIFFKDVSLDPRTYLKSVNVRDSAFPFFSRNRKGTLDDEERGLQEMELPSNLPAEREKKLLVIEEFERLTGKLELFIPFLEYR